MNLKKTPCSELITTNTYCCENNEILVENCVKVIEYNSIQVKLFGKGIVITVWGENLEINTLDKTSVLVCGKIQNIEFEEVHR